MTSRGIDYGMGETNIDRKTGIRYGVIPQNAISQAWADSSEGYYGDPTCGECGNPLKSYRNGENAKKDDTSFVCESCEIIYGDDWLSDYVNPISFVLDDGTYRAESDSDGDIFIYQSPYYTHTQFCSPCAPGACYLLNPCVDGEKCYCFNADWFDAKNEPCPYPIWRIVDDVQIYVPKEN